MPSVCAEGANRAAVATLCGSGGFTVQLRLPGPAAAGSDADQLGLGTPQFEDVPVGPAAWRKVGQSKELLVAADSIAALMGSRAFRSAESLLQSALGVTAGDVLYGVVGCEAFLVAGVPCAYRLLVREPAWA